uniref:Syntaxin-22-like n=1 Tax=Rhizophora mucronata TaxID=61149 RepID=A0A2P2LFY5_RHIMU
MSFQDLEAGWPLAASRRGMTNGRKDAKGMINGRQDATQAVASGIFQINTAVSTFQRLVNTLGTPKDTPDFREKLHKTRLHIGRLVKDTSAKLKQASETDHHAGVSVSLFSYVSFLYYSIPLENFCFPNSTLALVAGVFFLHISCSSVCCVLECIM